MGFLTGGGQALFGSLFHGLYSPATIYRRTRGYTNDGSPRVTSLEIPCRAQVDSATQRMVQAEGYAATDRAIYVLAASLEGDVDTDCQIEVAQGDYRADRYGIADVDRDPANAYWLCRGTLSGTRWRLAADVASTSTLAGTLVAEARLAVGVTALSTIAGALRAEARLVGPIAASATLAGLMRAEARLTATVAAASNVVPIFGPYPFDVLAFDPVNSYYRLGATFSYTAGGLPGYSFTRTGATIYEPRVYGPEILANPGPNFPNLNEWGPAAASSTLALSGGNIVATRTAATSTWVAVDTGVMLVAGKTYEIVAETTAPTTGAVTTSLVVWDNTLGAGIHGAQGGGTNSAARQRHSATVIARTTGPHSLAINRSAGDPNGHQTTLHSYSVREVLSAPAYGPERVNNGGFNANITGWGGAGWSWDPTGKARLTGDGTPQSFAQANVFEIGKRYRVSFDVFTDAGQIGFQNAAATLVVAGFNGTVTTEWVADTTALSFKRSVGIVNGTIDNVSVQEITPAPVSGPFAANVPSILPGAGYVPRGPLTNKCTNFNANPTALTNVTFGGDGAATLAVVDDTAALLASGLQNVCTSGKVYKLDNTAGIANAVAEIGGQMGNTNPHTVSVYMRGAPLGRVGFNTQGPPNMVIGALYARYSFTDVPSASTANLRITAPPGSVVYFILNQLVEGNQAGPIIPVAGAAASIGPASLDSGVVALGNDFYVAGRGNGSTGTGERVVFALTIGADILRLRFDISTQKLNVRSLIGGVGVNVAAGPVILADTEFSYVVRRTAAQITLFVRVAGVDYQASLGAAAFTGAALFSHHLAGSAQLNGIIRSAFIQLRAPSDAECLALLAAL